MVDLLRSFIKDVGHLSKVSAELSNREGVTDLDLQFALDQIGFDLGDLAKYAECSRDSAILVNKPLAPFPKPSPANLNFMKPGSREVLVRKVHVNDFYPPMFSDMENEDPAAGPANGENGVKAEAAEGPLVNGEASGEVKVEGKEDAAEDGELPDSPDHTPPHGAGANAGTFATPKQPATSGAGPESLPLREIKSVMMTSSGFISPAREGKLPDSRTPISAKEHRHQMELEAREEARRRQMEESRIKQEARNTPPKSKRELKRLEKMGASPYGQKNKKLSVFQRKQGGSPPTQPRETPPKMTKKEKAAAILRASAAENVTIAHNVSPPAPPPPSAPVSASTLNHITESIDAVIKRGIRESEEKEAAMKATIKPIKAPTPILPPSVTLTPTTKPSAKPAAKPAPKPVPAAALKVPNSKALSVEFLPSESDSSDEGEIKSPPVKNASKTLFTFKEEKRAKSPAVPPEAKPIPTSIVNKADPDLDVEDKGKPFMSGFSADIPKPAEAMSSSSDSSKHKKDKKKDKSKKKKKDKDKDKDRKKDKSKKKDHIDPGSPLSASSKKFKDGKESKKHGSKSKKDKRVKSAEVIYDSPPSPPSPSRSETKIKISKPPVVTSLKIATPQPSSPLSTSASTPQVAKLKISAPTPPPSASTTPKPPKKRAIPPITPEADLFSQPMTITTSSKKKSSSASTPSSSTAAAVASSSVPPTVIKTQILASSLPPSISITKVSKSTPTSSSSKSSSSRKRSASSDKKQASSSSSSSSSKKRKTSSSTNSKSTSSSSSAGLSSSAKSSRNSSHAAASFASSPSGGASDSSSSAIGMVTTQTVGHYVNADGVQIWICPACGKQDDGSPMIGCDECDDWYHWVCVGIVSEPDESQNWFCMRCVAKKAGNVLTTKR